MIHSPVSTLDQRRKEKQQNVKERKTNRTKRMRRRRKKKSFYPPLLLYRDPRLGRRKNDEDYSSLTHILPREVQRIKQIWIEMKTCAFSFSNDPSTLERQGRHRGNIQGGGNTGEYRVEGILENTG